jgi:CheY-like chemotaxis protein
VNFTKDLFQQLLDPKLSPSERAQLRCDLAKQLEEARNFEAARDAMGELWNGVGNRPNLDNLDQLTAGEVLLRAGTLTGFIGSTKQIPSAQESAKNLINESITIFETFHEVKRVAEAQIEIAVCYAREGELDNARVMLSEALSRLDEADADLGLNALLRSAIVEKLASRFSDALNILTKAAPLLEVSTNPTLRGCFHNELGNVLRRLGEIENCVDYLDRAVIEYTAASFDFEQVGNARYQACVENNLALLYLGSNRLPEAHEHLDTAQALFTQLKDNVHLAQVEDTRARVMFAEGATARAEKVARSSVQLLENGGEPILAEALITHGTILSHLGHDDEARTTLERAFAVAEQAGDLETAGVAALTLFEQLAGSLSENEMCEILDRAHELLKGSKNGATRNRLSESGFRALSLIHTSRPDWTSFSLEQTLHRHERRYIQMALEDAGGVVSRAARLLGLGSHQNLQYMLKNVHKDLRNVGVALADHDAQSNENVNQNVVERKIREVKILYIEDDATIAAVVQELTQEQGWKLKHHAEGAAASEELAGDTRYDLLIVDFALPDLNGLELIERVRSMFHRRFLPILIMSGTLDEAAAREAGADAFLQKPKGLSSVIETISRLLDQREETE